MGDNAVKPEVRDREIHVSLIFKDTVSLHDHSLGKP